MYYNGKQVRSSTRGRSTLMYYNGKQVRSSTRGRSTAPRYAHFVPYMSYKKSINSFPFIWGSLASHVRVLPYEYRKILETLPIHEGAFHGAIVIYTPFTRVRSTAPGSREVFGYLRPMVIYTPFCHTTPSIWAAFSIILRYMYGRHTYEGSETTSYKRKCGNNNNNKCGNKPGSVRVWGPVRGPHQGGDPG